MNVLDLFSGIGGFSLGLERAGMRTVAFCEIEPYCRAVLAKHWPDVPCYTDVRELTADRLVADGISADVICGGFPCQDISVAGKGAGITGARSGLWSHYARLIDEVRPKYVIVENVAALLSRGLGEVLGKLAAIGYDTEWHCIPASHVGAPHRRDRVWIIAYPGSEQHESNSLANQGTTASGFSQTPLADTAQQHGTIDGCEALESRRSREDVADPARIQSGRAQQRPLGQRTWTGGEPFAVADAQRFGCFPVVQSIGGRKDEQGPTTEIADSSFASGWGWWKSEPDVGRVAHGVPSRVDRLRALGNAVVPQIPEIIGRAIMRAQHV